MLVERRLRTGQDEVRALDLGPETPLAAAHAATARPIPHRRRLSPSPPPTPPPPDQTPHRRHRSAELGFGLCKDARGHGYATQAARLLMEFGFSALGLHGIHAGHHPDNVASSRVLERLGMTREGRLRKNLLAHGRLRDSVVYSMLEHEWRADAEAE